MRVDGSMAVLDSCVCLNLSTYVHTTLQIMLDNACLSQIMLNFGIGVESFLSVFNVFLVVELKNSRVPKEEFS